MKVSFYCMLFAVLLVLFQSAHSKESNSDVEYKGTYGDWKEMGDCNRPKEGKCSDEGTCCNERKGEQKYKRECSKPGLCDPELKFKKIKPCTIECSETAGEGSGWDSSEGSTSQGSLPNDDEDVTISSAKQPNWSNWVPGRCSVSCGSGTRKYTRRCNDGGDGDCGDGRSTKYLPCREKHCASWTGWESRGDCSASCGEGTQKFVRKCVGAGYCKGSPTKSETCFMKSCPSWSNWSAQSCSVTCGEGAQLWTRKCLDGTCKGASEEARICKMPECSDFSEWHLPLKQNNRCNRPLEGACSRKGTCCDQEKGEMEMIRECLKENCNPMLPTKTRAPCTIRCNEDYETYGPWRRSDECKRPSGGVCSKEGTCCGELRGKRKFTRQCSREDECDPNLPKTRAIACRLQCIRSGRKY